MLDILLSLVPDTLLGTLLMFWHALIFELPRCLIAAACLAYVELFQRQSNRLGAAQFDQFSAASAQETKVSVLLAGHNEGACLRQAIMGLREQTYQNFEIIVIDDGSSDDMAAVGHSLQSAGMIDLFLSTGLRGGKSAAANLGLGYCTGDLVVIADIDTSFDRDALERLIEPMQDPTVGAVSGNLAVRNQRATVITRFQAIQYLMSISMGRRITDMLGTLAIASGAFAVFRRSALQGIGGWEVGPGEDADITVKLRRAGWKISFQPHAWALTDVPDNSMALFRQRLRWNRSLIRVRARKFAGLLNPFDKKFSLSNAVAHIDIFFFQAFLPASFYLYLVGLFAMYGNAAIYILVLVSAVYAGAAVVGFLFAVSVTGKLADLRLLPYVPGYALYNAYLLRAVSVYSYFDEWFLRKSYEDSYVPQRVLDATEHH